MNSSWGFGWVLLTFFSNLAPKHIVFGARYGNFVPFAMFKQHWNQYLRVKPFGTTQIASHHSCASACLTLSPNNAFTVEKGCSLGTVAIGDQKFYQILDELEHVPPSKTLVYLDKKLVESAPPEIGINGTHWIPNPECRLDAHQLHFTVKSSSYIVVILSHHDSPNGKPCLYATKLTSPNNIQVFKCNGTDPEGTTLLDYNSTETILSGDTSLAYYLTWKDGKLELGQNNLGAWADITLFSILDLDETLEELKDPKTWIRSIGFQSQTSDGSYFSYDAKCYLNNFRTIKGNDVLEKYKTQHTEMIFFDFSRSLRLELSHRKKSDPSHRIPGRIHLWFYGGNSQLTRTNVVNATHNETVDLPGNKSFLVSFEINSQSPNAQAELVILDLNQTIPILELLDLTTKLRANGPWKMAAGFQMENQTILTGPFRRPMKCTMENHFKNCNLDEMKLSRQQIPIKIANTGFNVPFGPFERQIIGIGTECTQDPDDCATIWRLDLK